MSWTVPMSLVDSPERIDNDFFHVVPPTPSQFAGQPTHPIPNSSTNPLVTYLHTPERRSVSGRQDSVGVEGGHHLGASLKSHRSMSSVGSVDSHVSHISRTSKSGWSTVDTYNSDPSDLDPDADFMGPGQGYAYPGLPIQASKGQHHPSSVLNGDSIDGHSGHNAWGCVIDPRLFQSKEKIGEVSPSPVREESKVSMDGMGGQQTGGEVETDVEQGVEVVIPETQDEEKVLTAKPRRSPKKISTEPKKKVSHARKQHPEHIPRPRNAFILFRKHVVDSKLIPPSVEMRHQNVSVIVAKMWSEADAEQKARFNELARIEKEEHMKKYPGYRYQPVYRRTNVVRRRVRKDDAEEEKCNSVAELLMKGKTGHELEAEIKDKIRRDSTPGPKRKKSPISGANELSKGALRALRAQARHQSTPSVDWSEASCSRANSSEVDSMPFRSTIGGDMAYDVPQDDMPYMSELETYYGDPVDSYGWGFGASIGQGQVPVQQTYAYPQDEGRVNQYMYPQPPNISIQAPVAPNFYTFDQALPFSPTAAGMGSFSTMQMQMAAPMMGFEPESIDPEHDFLVEQYPSPTSGMYGSGLSGPLRVPMSARWDRAHGSASHLLPTSSEVPLESLFDTTGGGTISGDDSLLHDFGAALAQTEDGIW